MLVLVPVPVREVQVLVPVRAVQVLVQVRTVQVLVQVRAVPVLVQVRAVPVPVQIRVQERARVRHQQAPHEQAHKAYSPSTPTAQASAAQ